MRNSFASSGTRDAESITDDNEDFDLEAMKSMIRNRIPTRIQTSYYIYEAWLNMRNATKCTQLRALWTQAFPTSSLKNGQLKLSIP
jgi:hypothetical protein